MPVVRPGFTRTLLAAIAALATTIALVAVGSATPADAAVPNQTFTNGFDDANRDVAFDVANCGHRPGLTTVTSPLIAGTHSARSGVLTPTASNDYGTPFFQIIPGTSTVSLQALATSANGSPRVDLFLEEPDGTRTTLASAALTTTAQTFMYTIPAGAPERVEIHVDFRSATNVNSRAIFDSFQVTSIRQATKGADPAGTETETGCEVEEPPAISFGVQTPDPVEAGSPAAIDFIVDNPNLKDLTLEQDLFITPATGMVVATGGAGTCTASVQADSIVIATGATIPAAGCTVPLAATPSAAGTFGLGATAPGAVTEAGTSGPATTDINAIAGTGTTTTTTTTVTTPPDSTTTTVDVSPTSIGTSTTTGAVSPSTLPFTGPGGSVGLQLPVALILILMGVGALSLSRRTD